MNRQLDPPVTRDQIETAVQRWNMATVSERFAMYCDLLALAQLYRLSTLEKLGKLNPMKTISVSDLTEELVNTMVPL